MPTTTRQTNTIRSLTWPRRACARRAARRNVTPIAQRPTFPSDVRTHLDIVPPQGPPQLPGAGLEAQRHVGQVLCENPDRRAALRRVGAFGRVSAVAAARSRLSAPRLTSLVLQLLQALASRQHLLDVCVHHRHDVRDLALDAVQLFVRRCAPAAAAAAAAAASRLGRRRDVVIRVPVRARPLRSGSPSATRSSADRSPPPAETVPGVRLALTRATRPEDAPGSVPPPLSRLSPASARQPSLRARQPRTCARTRHARTHSLRCHSRSRCCRQQLKQRRQEQVWRGTGAALPVGSPTGESASLSLSLSLVVESFESFAFFVIALALSSF